MKRHDGGFRTLRSGFYFFGVMLVCVVSSSIASTGACKTDCIDYDTYLHWITCTHSGDYQTTNDVCISGTHAYLTQQSGLGGWPGLQILDISDPRNPVVTGNVTTPGEAVCVAVSGSLAYVTCHKPWNGLVVIDVTEPTGPTVVGTLGLPETPAGLAIIGNRVYVAVTGVALMVLDVSQPQHMRILASLPPIFPMPWSASDVAMAGDLAFVVGPPGLAIIDVADANHLRLVSTIPEAHGESVAVSAGYAYVTGWPGLTVIDAREPERPAVAAILPAGKGLSVEVFENCALVSGWEGVLFINVSDPTDPVMSASCQTVYPMATAMAGPYVFVADYSGLAVIARGNDQAVPVLGNVGGLPQVERLAAAGSFVYVPDEDGHLSIVDATDPTMPQIVGSYNFQGYSGGVAAAANYVYISVRQGPSTFWLMTIDVSDPAQPHRTSLLSMPGTGNLVAAGDRLYAITGYRLHVLSLANPAHPVELGNHVTGLPADLAVSGRLVFVASGYFGLMVFDATDPAAIRDLGSVTFGPNAEFVSVSGSYAYVSTGYGGVFVVDVADPSSPEIVSRFDTVALTWDLDAAGSVVYVADWAGSLQVEDVSDPTAPRILGRVDTASYIAMGALAQEDRVYVAGYSDGLLIVPVQCDRIRRLARMVDAAPPKQGTLVCSPNPFNPRTAITFTSAVAGPVTLTVYDLRGQQVAHLLDGPVGDGEHGVDWWGMDDSGRSLPSGTYFCRLVSAAGVETQKLTVVR